MSTKSKTPSYKFYVEIRSSYMHFDMTYEYFAVIRGLNNETVFFGETRKRKSSLIKTINNLFPNVVIKDKTK